MDEETKVEPKIVTELAQIGEVIKEARAKEVPKFKDEVLLGGHWIPSKVEPPLYRIFVYGTMKHGFNNHHFISKGQCITVNASVDDYCLSLDGDLPVMFKHITQQVWGSIFEINQEMLDVIDELEGIRFNFYRREEVQTYTGNSMRKIPCWAYVRNPPQTSTYKHVISGSYTGKTTFFSVKPTPDIDGHMKLEDRANWQAELDRQYPVAKPSEVPVYQQGILGHPINCSCVPCWSVRNNKNNAGEANKKVGPRLLDPGIFLWGYPVLDDGTRSNFK